jgi:hypothetical protein
MENLVYEIYAVNCNGDFILKHRLPDLTPSVNSLGSYVMDLKLYRAVHEDIVETLPSKTEATELTVDAANFSYQTNNDMKQKTYVVGKKTYVVSFEFLT